MNENPIIKNNILIQLINFTKKNFKITIIFLSICFIIFVLFQIFNFYTLNKIKNNSISFFNVEYFENENIVKEPILKLSKENNFYGLLSKLELIEISLNEKDYLNATNIYMDILSSKDMDNIYKAAIASKAAYQFIDISFQDLSKSYSQKIKIFLSFIDEDLISYQGISLELKYLIKILEAEQNNVEYKNNNEAIDLYNIIINSDIASPVIKERINKIHDFFSYK